MSQRIRIKLKSYDYNLVDKSAEKIVKNCKVNRVGCEWTYSASNQQEDFYRFALAIRKQKIQGTISIVLAQKNAGYFLDLIKNSGCTDEAGVAQWS